MHKKAKYNILDCYKIEILQILYSLISMVCNFAIVY